MTFLNWIAAKIMKNYKKSLKMTKSLTFLNWIAAKFMKNDEKSLKMTKSLTFLNWIAAKIMKKYKNNNTIDIFELDSGNSRPNITRPIAVSGLGDPDFGNIKLRMCPHRC